MKRIVFWALPGWAGIVWLAHLLADRRVTYCQNHSASCNVVENMATRDNVLIWGAAIALLGLIVAAVTEYRSRRANRVSSVTRGPRRLVR